MAHVIFIHGIKNKPASQALLQLWKDALATGRGIDLGRQGITSEMVYWADVLYDKPWEERTAEAVEIEDSQNLGDVLASLTKSAEHSQEEAEFLSGLAGKLSIATMRAAVGGQIAGRRDEESVPLPWSIKEPLMAWLLRDVHHYLFNVRFSPRPGSVYFVQDEIRRRFVAALQRASQYSPPYIVVSHSMGTVIAYDCLKRVSGIPAVHGLMTIGSPLGLGEIQEKLQPGWSQQDGFPTRTLQGRWINVFDPLDPVAGFAPRLAQDYRQQGLPVIRDIIEENSGWWRHDIQKYLSGVKLRGSLRELLHLPESVESEAVPQENEVSPRPASDKLDKAKERSRVASFTEGEDLSSLPGAELLDRLRGAIEESQHKQVAWICDQMVRRLCFCEPLFDTRQSLEVLKQLRRNRYFRQMIQVGDALLQSGVTLPQIRRNYAQGLIDNSQGLTDTGSWTAALEILNDIVARETDESEIAEARGLIGRIYKQLYVNAANAGASACPEILRKSIQSYYEVYSTDPEKYSWHGINVVALLARAERDQVSLDGFPFYQEIARDILSRFGKAQSLDLWAEATTIEAYIAIHLYGTAVKHAKKLVQSKDVDAFTLASLLRQLKELWQLNPADENQGQLLALLQSELMRREGFEMSLNATDLQAQPLLKLQREGTLEKVFGDQGAKTLRWYQTGLKRCKCIARFETKSGRGMGTGFVVSGSELEVPALSGKFLVLTNAHVVSDDPKIRPALRSDEAVVTFQFWQQGNTNDYKVASIVWSSPPGELDATLVELTPGLENCEGFDKWAKPVKDEQKSIYLIGHPLGGELSLSLHDNKFIGFRDPKLHYRTPSEPGSSGSPVFNDEWEFIGLHHSGSFNMKPLDGTPGTIEANEGISLHAIREALKNSFGVTGSQKTSQESIDRSTATTTTTTTTRPISPLSRATENPTVRVETPVPREVARPVSPKRPPSLKQEDSIVTYSTICSLLGADGEVRQHESVGSSQTPQSGMKLLRQAAEEVISDSKRRAELLAECATALGELKQESAIEGGGVMSTPPHRMASLLQSTLAEAREVSHHPTLEFAFDKDDTKEALKEFFKRAKEIQKHHQPRPASATPEKISDFARLALVSDFGTGLYGAPVIADSLRKTGPFQLIMHLGDIYYSGLPQEVQTRFLDLWPKDAGELSRNLNGNHDMYSGGYGYFDVALEAFEQPASYFAYQNKHWLLVCLDTSYKDNNLGKTQLAWLEDVVSQSDNRRVILFSHHPLFSNFKDAGEKLASKLHTVLSSGRIAAWYWGHEHHCVIYDRDPHYKFYGRCLGHGGMPYRRSKVAEFPVDENFASEFNPGNIEWRKSVTPRTPTAYYLDGPNPYVIEEPQNYGPHGYLSLEFKGSIFKEQVHAANGRVIYERTLR